MGKVLAKICPKSADNSYTSNAYFQAWQRTVEDRDGPADDASSYSSGSSPFRRITGWRSGEDITKVYRFGQLTGCGGFAKVLLAQPLLPEVSDHLSVVKTVHKSDRLVDSFAMREAELLRQLDHPNIVKFQEVYEDPESFHLVLEYLRGGTLLDYLLAPNIKDTGLQTDLQITPAVTQIAEARGRQLDPTTTERILWQVLVAVAYLHSNSIVHGDLKPENLVFDEPPTDASGSQTTACLKLVDFGLAQVTTKRTQLTTFSGSRYFLAPEVLNSSYTEKRDIWSIGVLLYVMLSGTFPFFGDSDEQLFDSIRRGDYPEEPLRHAPTHLQGLVRSMLAVQPDARWGASGYLAHDCLLHHRSELVSTARQLLTPDALARLKRGRPDSMTRREVANIILSTHHDWPPPERDLVRQARTVFLAVDSDCSGCLDFDKLECFLRGVSPDPETDADLVLHHSRKQQLSYTEWLVSWLPLEVVFAEQKVRSAFAWVDVDSDGSVCISDLEVVMARTGRRFTRSQLELMISEVDTNNDRRWSWQEFKQHFDWED